MMLYFFCLEAGANTLRLKAIAQQGIGLACDAHVFNERVLMKYIPLKAQRWLTPLWSAGPSLTLVGLMMVCDLAACLAAMMFDARQITGVNAWLKPAKFGLSSAVTCLTLAWIAGYLGDWPRIRNWSGKIFATSIAIEIIVIDMQAGRGTTSHFNTATPFDRAAFIVMGVSICTLWLSMAAMTYALLFQRLKPSSWAWALRLGLLLSLLGAAGGGFMLRQTPEQRPTTKPALFGSHTVGAPDGGPGLPIANWSEHHGDLRVAHFLGLHAVQIIPLIGWWLLRKQRLTELQRFRLVWLASGTYISVFALLTWQALRGQALFEPDRKTLIAAAIALLFAGMGTLLVLLPPAHAALHKWARTFEVQI